MKPLADRETLAFIFGCLPLWTATGAGAASRQILGTVVVGGMFLSTAIGLIFIPVTFSVVEYLSHRFSRGGRGTTMDSKADFDPVAAGKAAGSGPRTPWRSRVRNFTMSLKRTYAIAMVALLASALAGCTVGRKYRQPVYPAPPAFRGADEAAVVSDAQNSLGDQQWSQVFREPELQDLIRKALANNYDVRIAAQRILEQQSQVQITRSQQFPTLSVGGTGVGLDVPSLNSLNSSSSNSSSISPLAEGAFSLSLPGTLIFGAFIANRPKRPAINSSRRHGRSAPSG